MDNDAKNQGRPSRSKPAGGVISSPGPISESYRPGKGPGGQASRSTYQSVNRPGEAGIGYDAATPENSSPGKGIKKDAGAVPAPRPRKSCPPGQNTGSDYYSPQQGYTIRRNPKSTG